MPKVLSEDLREAGAVILLEFARSKYPEYSDAQLSSLFKRASKKVKTKRTSKTVAVVETAV